MAARSQFFVTVFAEKQIQHAAPKNCYCHPPEATSHNNSYDLAYFFIGMNVIIRQAHNFIMCKGIKPSSHCLHRPSLPTPPTSIAVASHSLLVPRNFMPFPAPTAANISSYLVISAAKTYCTFQFYKVTSRIVFVYKSVLQVTSRNLSIQHTFPLLQAISVVFLVRPLFFQHLSVWQVRTSRTPAITHSIATVTAKYTH